MTMAAREGAGRLRALSLAFFPLLVAGLAAGSLFVGVSEVSPAVIMAEGLDGRAAQVVLVSRLPRTLALVLSGASLAVAGLIMQMMVRNRFVEPSTAGTVEGASLGILAAAILAPGLPVWGRMAVAMAGALAATALFLRVLRMVPLRSSVMVPLIGIVLASIIGAATTFLAYRFDLLQSVQAWTTGDFSVVLAGRYEFLWAAAAVTLAAYLLADRFTVAGLGEAFTTGLGLNHRRVLASGVVMVALVSAVVVVSVGAIPFLGLIVPNVVSMAIGDNVRRALPWVALVGAGLVLACDILGRLVIRPYEIPIGTMMGTIGSAFFLYLLLRGRRHAG